MLLILNKVKQLCCKLKCTVQTCVHNKQFLCDLDEITVGGESAKIRKRHVA